MSDSRISFVISALDQTRQAFDSVGNGFRNLENQSRSSLGAISAEWKKAAGVMATFFSTYQAAGFLKEVGLLAARHETLGVVMNKIGQNAGYNSAQMAAFDKALQSAGISMIESRQTLSQMAQAQLDLTKSSELARVAQDAAVIGNINSSEAFQRLVYGIQSAQVEMLRTIGINVNFENSYAKAAAAMGRTAKSFTEAEKAEIRMNAALEAGGKIAGTYEAAMTTAGKQITSFSRYLEDFKVKMGQAFNPATAGMVDSLTQVMKKLQDEISDPRAQEALAALSKEFSTLVVNAGERAPEAIRKTLVALEGIVAFYNALPSELVSAAGMGIVGRMLFGAGPGKILFALASINSALSRVGMNIGSLSNKWRQGAGAMQNLIDVATGKRDWNTGALKRGSVSGYADVAGLAKAEAGLLNSLKVPAIPTGGGGLKTGGGGSSAASKAKGEADRAREAYARLVEQADKFIRKASEEVELAGLTGLRAALRQNEIEYENTLKTFAGLKGAKLDEATASALAVKNMKDEAAVLKETNDQRQKAVNAAKEQAQHEREMAELARLNSEKYGTFAEGWATGLKEFQENAITTFKAGREAVASLAGAMSTTMSTMFFDVITGRFESLRDAFKSFGDSILRIFTDMLAQMAGKSMMSGLGGLFGGAGLLGGLFGGGATAAAGSTFGASSLGGVFSSGLLFHGGGTVGGEDRAYYRIVPSAAFAGAPRLHGGLAADEYAAILRRGESVFTAGQTSALGRAMSGRGESARNEQPVININIAANDAKSFYDMTKRTPQAIIDPIMDALKGNRINRSMKELLR